MNKQMGPGEPDQRSMSLFSLFGDDLPLPVARESSRCLDDQIANAVIEQQGVYKCDAEEVPEAHSDRKLHFAIARRMEGIQVMANVARLELDWIFPAEEAEEVDEQRPQRAGLEYGVVDQLMEPIEKKRPERPVQVNQSNNGPDWSVPLLGRVPRDPRGRARCREQEKMPQGLQECPEVATCGELAELVSSNWYSIPLDWICI